MSFHFVADVEPFDFFKMSLRKTYKSPVGICNIVFTVAAILLTIRFFAEASGIVQPILLFMCMLFPVIQPLSILWRARQLSGRIPKGLVLDADDSGITVSVGPQSEKIGWDRVSNLLINKDMLVIRLDDNHGYFLTDGVLKDDREAFKEFVLSKLRNR